MIFDHQKFEVGKLTAEVNYNDKVVPCLKVKFKLDDKEEEVELKDLYALLMLFGDDHMQDKLISVKETEMVLIERMLHVRPKKDIKAGELMTFPYRYSITKEGYEELVKNNPRQYRIVEDLSTKAKQEDGVQKKAE